MKLPLVKKATLSWWAYETMLRDRGYEVIGSGVYARVYSKPGSGHVIKVGTADHGFKSDPYLAFLRKIDPTNVHFPRVHKVEMYRDTVYDCSIGRSSYYVVTMERLEKFERVHWKRREKVFTSLGLTNYHCLHEGCSTRINRDNFQLRKLAYALDDLYSKHKEDLHSDNLMWRVNGSAPQLVIVDPVSPRNTTEY